MRTKVTNAHRASIMKSAWRILRSNTSLSWSKCMKLAWKIFKRNLPKKLAKFVEQDGSFRALYKVRNDFKRADHEVSVDLLKKMVFMGIDKVFKNINQIDMMNKFDFDVHKIKPKTVYQPNGAFIPTKVKELISDKINEVNRSGETLMTMRYLPSLDVEWSLIERFEDEIIDSLKAQRFNIEKDIYGGLVQYKISAV